MRHAAAILAAVALALAAASPAAATTEFGSDCTAVSLAGGYTLADLGHGAASPLPAAAPASGVITSWRVNVAPEVPIPAGFETLYRPELVVMRPTAAPLTLTAVGLAAAPQVAHGVNVYPARLPVQAGDMLGLTNVVPLCELGEAGNLGGSVKRFAAVGDTIAFESAPARPAVAAAIEPDVDGDGYGDETQDGCPQSALSHEACPTLALGGYAEGLPRLTVLYLTASLAGTARMSGEARWGKGGRVRLNEPEIPLAPGTVTRTPVPYPPALLRRLRQMTPKQKLTLRLTVTAPNIVGTPAVKALAVKLRGQG